LGRIGPALFNKVTLFSLPEVFYWPQICQKCGRPRTPPPQRRSWLCLFFGAQLLWPPM